uniref:Uncharacterized protein n=1 Tax=Physcomitrium patens TaxID=3218 RepID=A0A2K1KTZ8_PHYPA|nr:hypothetical protein PHYPA_004258 [Physcomitrium patens]
MASPLGAFFFCFIRPLSLNGSVFAGLRRRTSSNANQPTFKSRTRLLSKSADVSRNRWSWTRMMILQQAGVRFINIY